MQYQILTILAKHPEVQRKVLLELAKDLHFRQKLLMLAGQRLFAIGLQQGTQGKNTSAKEIFAFDWQLP